MREKEVMIFFERIIFFAAAMMVSTCAETSFSKKISYFCKGAAVHVLNHTCPNLATRLCPLSEKQKQLKLFGYDLGIEYHTHSDNRFFKPEKRAIFYLHPWGVVGMPNKNHAHLLKLYDVLPGDLITFNFPDGIWRAPIPAWYSSLGQLSDVLPALYALNYATDTFDLKAIDLFGYSRGGAVAVNMLAVLHDKSGTYDAALAEIGITSAKRKQLIALVENGSVVLNCPLIDGNVTLKKYSRTIQFLAHTFTNYKHDGLQALQSAQLLSDLKLQVLLHFQYNDTRVTNQKEAELYNAFAQCKLNTTYLLLGNDGGHVHSHDALSKAIHLFYKHVGGAYDTQQLQAYEEFTRNNQGSIACLLQPSVEESKQIIASFHRSCRKK